MCDATLQVRDLRRLLELYQRWHPRVFPHGTYNQFEQSLEKMSGTHALKVHIQQMSTGLAAVHMEATSLIHLTRVVAAAGLMLYLIIFDSWGRCCWFAVSPADSVRQDAAGAG